MDEKRQIQDLADLGLTERESKVYLALVQSGAIGASDILKMAEVPKSKIYEILQKLIDKGLCLEKSHGYGKKYQAVNPTKALHSLIRKREEELEQLKKKADQNIESLLKIYRDPSLREPFEFVQILKHPDHVADFYLVNKRNVRKEFLEFSKPPFVCSPEVLKNEPAEHNTLIKRGVKIKIIHEFIVVSNQELREAIIEDKKIGVENRFVESLPMKLAIFDSLKVLVCMLDPVMLKPLPTSLFIEHSGLAGSLELTFESIWKDAIPSSEYFGEES